MNLISLLVALYAAAVVTGLWAGRGVCRTCGTACPPWNNHCWRHTPHP